MKRTLHLIIVDRQEIGPAYFSYHQTDRFHEFDIDNLDALPIPRHGAAIGAWNIKRHDLLPDIILVNDEDKSDTLSWLSSYLVNLTPITQSTRILARREVDELRYLDEVPTLSNVTGAWLGAIVAECRLQGGDSVKLSDLSGLAAKTSATFSAARCHAVWQRKADFEKLAVRHDQISTGLGSIKRNFFGEILATRVANASRCYAKWS